MRTTNTKRKRIGRFQLCCLVHYAAARRLAYTDGEAKCLAIQRAIFFAAAKRGFGVKPKSTRKAITQRQSGSVSLEDSDEVMFAGEEIEVERDQDGYIRRASIGSIEGTAEAFDRQVTDRFGVLFSAAAIRATERLAPLTQWQLTGAKTSVFDVYKTIRDEWQQQEWIDSLAAKAA